MIIKIQARTATFVTNQKFHGKTLRGDIMIFFLLFINYIK